MLKKYIQDSILNLKTQDKYYYNYYIFSVITTYILITIFSWYFVHLAYTTEPQNYNILGNKLITIILYYLLFNLVLYLITEISFRVIFYFNLKDKLNTKYYNIITLFFTFLTYITIIFLLK